jgi:hypothetical protein
VEVVVFGLDGNVRRVVVARTAAGPPAVRVEPPVPDTVARGLRLLAGDTTPPPADPSTAAVFQALAEKRVSDTS